MLETIQALLKGLGLGLLLSISVGPVVFTIIKQSINNGKEGGFSFVAGVWFSDLLLITVSNLFSLFVTHLMVYKRPIGLGGSLLLMSMGAFYVFFKKVNVHPEDISLPPLKASDHTKIALQGFFLNTLNPAVMLFWLTAATTLAVTHTIYERIIIFLTCFGTNVAADIGKVTLAGRLRKKMTVHNIRILNRVSGSILLIFGAIIFIGVMFFVKRKM